MGEDAIDRWRREADFGHLPDSGSTPPAARPGKAWPAASAVLGFAVTLLLLIARDAPPQALSPVYLLVCALVPAAAVAFRRPGIEVAQSAFAVAAATFLTLLVAIPVWAVGEALECWASWLAEC